MRSFLFLSLFLYNILVFSQSFVVSGKITDVYTGEPLVGVSINIEGSSNGTFSNNKGQFQLKVEGVDECTLVSNLLGYYRDTTIVDLSDVQFPVNIGLYSKELSLDEIEIKSQRVFNNVINSNQIAASNLDTDPLKILSAMPGLTTMNIGANLSKPIIRGLGFDRIAVLNRGILQQNQQWGADHGIDIDLLDVKTARIYKGPSSLLLGSTGLSTLEITPNGFGSKADFVSGEAFFIGASNNDLIGVGFVSEFMKNKWYGRINYSYKDYADYRVPNNSIHLDHEIIDLKDKRISNTAGREQTISGTIGFKDKNITTYLNVGNLSKKNGIFELEHNHEDEDGDDHHHDDDHEHHDSEHSSHDHDDQNGSGRSINLPYAQSNHFTVTNNTLWEKSPSFKFHVNTGFQYNNRSEYEIFHAHYTGQEPPLTNDNLAVNFKLRSYSSNARLHLDEDKSWSKIIGTNVEYLKNKIAGYEYFLPAYYQFRWGASFVNKINLSNRWKVEAGLRYDLNRINIDGYYDHLLAEYLNTEGYIQPTIDEHAQRSHAVDRTLNGWSGSIGASYQTDKFSLKAYLGSSLRFPSANELATNGLHHAAYRYEIGDPNLKAERGYTFDLELQYDHESKFAIYFNPFFSYYTNFIYLNPFDSESSVIIYDEKPYKHSQAKAIFGGGEFNLKWFIYSKLSLSSGGSLVLNKNLDNHDYLPFTPPFSMLNELKFKDKGSKTSNVDFYQFSISHQLFAQQARVAQGEESTPGANLFNLNIGVGYKLFENMVLNVNLQVNNIFDTSYLNHLSLYRRIMVPEQGRNVLISVRIPFFQ